MDVGWTCARVYLLFGQEFGELARQEFAGIVAVQRPNNTGGMGRAARLLLTSAVAIATISLTN
eukprot:624950-Pleurochrysis_carterae.AAC.1